MSPLRLVPLIVLCLFTLCLGACSHQPQQEYAGNTVYCDRYLIYRMCAIDVSHNGQADFLYFEDSAQIFLFDPERVNLVPANLTMHKCAQSMDEPLINATSRLLTVNDEMSFFERSEIKNKIFYHYIRYVPRINRCNRAAGNQDESVPESDEFVTETDEFVSDTDDFVTNEDEFVANGNELGQ